MKKDEFSKTRKKAGIIQKARYKMENELIQPLSRKKLLRGSLYPAYKSCRKKGCKCMRGEKHGPFLYLSDKIAGKSKMVFIKKSISYKAIELAGNYLRWRKMRAQIAKYNAQLLHLIDEIEKMNTISVADIERSNSSNNKKKRSRL